MRVWFHFNSIWFIFTIVCFFHESMVSFLENVISFLENVISFLGIHKTNVNLLRYTYAYTYTKILEVNLFAFAYRLFHEDFFPINGALHDTQPLSSFIYINLVGFLNGSFNLFCPNLGSLKSELYAYIYINSWMVFSAFVQLCARKNVFPILVSVNFPTLIFCFIAVASPSPGYTWRLYKTAPNLG